MKKMYLPMLLLFPFILNAQSPAERTWTYTYLKAHEGEQKSLSEFIEKNWLAMDSVAVQQGLLASYELIENTGESKEWDYLVAVEYFTANTYEAIAERFEQIRAAHRTHLVNNKGLRELGRIVRSETVRKRKTSGS